MSHFVFLVYARDGAVKTAKTAFFASIRRSRCYLHCSLGENRECLPRFVHDQLRFDKSGRNNSGNLEITFWRACLIAVVPPN